MRRSNRVSNFLNNLNTFVFVYCVGDSHLLHTTTTQIISLTSTPTNNLFYEIYVNLSHKSILWLNIFNLITGLSDSESDSSSLERKRGGDAYKSNRKAQGQHKRRVPKKRIPIAVGTPKIPIGFDPNSSTGMNPAALMYQKLKNEINSSIEKGNCCAMTSFLIKFY